MNSYFVYRDIDLDCEFLGRQNGRGYHSLKIQMKLRSPVYPSRNRTMNSNASDTTERYATAILIPNNAAVTFSLHHPVSGPSLRLDQEGCSLYFV